eukprot:TRINITY_DN4848_c0_g1_i2.p1 TRINITY_DN4848_c0_g1~~TRINITY_DN4848_c0_g1_i2.p1  ORF type:complete len:372 (-),score=24.58 TRINITY_DN4848_c0_g1_i2:28-1143(-)
MNLGFRWTAGIICICIVPVFWTFATFLKQVITDDMKFNQPIIISYVGNACYVIYLPIFVLGRKLGLIDHVPWKRAPATPTTPSTPPPIRSIDVQNGHTHMLETNPETCASVTTQRSFTEGGSSVTDAALTGMVIAPVWFLSQCLYTAGVSETTATTSTAISATSVVWTLLASMLFLGERATCGKLIGVALCLGGNVVAISGGDFQGGSFQGDIWCMISAMCYGAYTTILRYLATDDMSVILLFGFLGLTLVIIGAPISMLAAMDGWKELTWPIFGLLVGNGCIFNVIAQFIWAKAVQFTSPTTTTVGLSMTIPLGMIVDYVRHQSISLLTVLSSALIMCGFFTATLATRADQTQKSPPAMEVDGLRDPAAC